MLYRDLKVYKSTLAPASVARGTSAEQTFTITGLVAATDVILRVIKPSLDAGVGIVGARVSADNQVGLTFMNFTDPVTGSAVVPTEESYLIVAGRVGGSSISNGDRL